MVHGISGAPQPTLIGRYGASGGGLSEMSKLYLSTNESGRVRRYPGNGLQQGEFLRPADRRTPVLHAELAVHGALVGLHSIERDIQPLADLTAR